ncbi:MAG TPA: M20/M25/M40 family metallo-hydrolase [Gemmatimonadaceae bacterium]
MRSACSVLLLALASVLGAQELPPSDSLGPIGRVVQSWIALRVSPGREAHAMLRIREQLSEWRPGPLGSLALTRGEGSPHRVVACGLDETSYVVSNITDDGYLRVHVAGSRAHPPTWDAMHVGQRIVVLTTDRADATRVRAVSGVFGVRSTHLWRGGQGVPAAPVTLEDLWIDVGARTRAEVAALGVRLLDPVFRDAPDWSVGDAVVGPAASARAGCAAVAAAAEQTPVGGRTTFVISSQSSFNWSGLAAVMASQEYVDSLFIAMAPLQRPASAAGAAAAAPADAFRSLRSSRVGTITGIVPRSQYTGTLVETIREADLRSLFDDVARAAGGRQTTDPRHVRITSAALRPPQPTDSLSRYAELLARLTDTYAVSGDEAPTREVVRARLPAWAREQAMTDSIGDLILGMGPDRDTVVFVAHMDEVGFEVVRAQNGVATLRQLGGFYPWLFSGQPALLHARSLSVADRAQGCRPTSGTAIRGVFLPPDSSARDTREIQAWFGDQLASTGDVVGARVSGFKCATRLAGTRFSARSIDDRLGSGALIFALDGIDAAKLDHKVIFVWSVQEETGLAGARAVAAQFGNTVRRVHAVDTFVSGDSPFETGRFAVVPIGTGAVLRALDNSSTAPPGEIERVIRIARSAGIPLQVNLTNGGTDGAAFVAYGATNVMVGWPLRYSHSPAEVIDLRDMRSLSRLLTALALAPVR